MPLLVNREVVQTEIDDSFIAFADYLQLEFDAQRAVTAVRASGEDSLDELIALSDRFAVIALEFPVLRDGRAFSFAHELRVAGFAGQIRAVGETSRDKLSFLERCGFDAVELDDAGFRREHLEAYTEISVKYQGAIDQPLPIYRQTEVSA